MSRPPTNRPNRGRDVPTHCPNGSDPGGRRRRRRLFGTWDLGDLEKDLRAELDDLDDLDDLDHDLDDDPAGADDDHDQRRRCGHVRGLDAGRGLRKWWLERAAGRGLPRQPGDFGGELERAQWRRRPIGGQSDQGRGRNRGRRRNAGFRPRSGRLRQLVNFGKLGRDGWGSP